MPEWIPVADRLPPPGVYVLIALPAQDAWVPAVVISCRRRDDLYRVVPGRERTRRHASHWMPIPDFPA
jgi:hypothetical protein